MTDRFNADILLNCATSDDGKKTTFVLSDCASAPQMTLTVSPDFLERLMLTLPMILLDVRERREQVRDCRLPCALEKLDISLAWDQTTRVMTFTTPDEVSVSFHVSEEQLAEITRRNAALAEQVRRSLQ